jgi:hypothetical protein
VGTVAFKCILHCGAALQHYGLNWALIFALLWVTLAHRRVPKGHMGTLEVIWVENNIGQTQTEREERGREEWRAWGNRWRRMVSGRTMRQPHTSVSAPDGASVWPVVQMSDLNLSQFAAAGKQSCINRKWIIMWIITIGHFRIVGVNHFFCKRKSSLKCKGGNKKLQKPF